MSLLCKIITVINTNTQRSERKVLICAQFHKNLKDNLLVKNSVTIDYWWKLINYTLK